MSENKQEPMDYSVVGAISLKNNPLVRMNETIAKVRMRKIGWEEPLTEEQRKDLRLLPDKEFKQKYNVSF